MRNLLQRWASACRSSSGLAVILIAASPIVWASSTWGVRLLYDERIPILSGRLFRSRDVFDVDFYLELTATYRWGLAWGILGIGLFLLLNEGGRVERALWTTSSYVIGRLEKRRGYRTAVAAACAIALSGVAWAPGYPIFETNDDAAFAAILSGAWTGEPDPRTGFIGRHLAELLVALAAAAPGVPWWGVTLFAGQSVAILLLIYLVIRSARADVPQPLWWMALATVLAFGVYSALFLQFTHVSISLGGAALLLLADSARMRGWVVFVRAAFAVPLIVIAAQVRDDGVVLAVALVTTSYFFPYISLHILRCKRLGVPIGVVPQRSLAAAVLTLGVAAFAVAATLPSGVDGASPSDSEWSAPLFPEQACLREEQQSSWVKFALGQTGTLSENDVRLINSWVRPTSTMFGSDPLADMAERSSAALRIDCELWRGSPKLPRWMGVLGLGMLVLTIMRNGMSRASRNTAALSLGGSLALLLLLDAVARAPLRVVFPAITVIAVGLLVAAAAAPASETGDRSRAPQSLGMVTAAAFLLPALVGVVLVFERLQIADNDALAKLEFNDLRAEVTEIAVFRVVLGWLDPISESSPALAMPLSIDEGRPVPVAGWTAALPGLEEVHERLRVKDWVEAVTDDREVLLIASPERVRIILHFLRERRGFGCPTPVRVAESESWVVVAGVVDGCNE